MEGVIAGGAVPSGLRRMGGAADGTGTLETGGVGMEERPPPLPAWLHGVGRLDGGIGGVDGAAGSTVGPGT